MSSTVKPQQEGATRPLQEKTLSKRTLKLQKWDSYRDEIYQTYVLQNHTLQTTMKMIKEKHNFAPSERKFKEKIKEWKFEKYLSTEEAKFISTKAKAREGQGKDTTFYKHGVKIDQKRVEKSAKRKREEFNELEDITAPTPDQITYSTPAPLEDNDAIPLLQNTNKRQTIRHPTPQKLDSSPDFPPVNSPNNPFWTPFDDDNDNPVLSTQMDDEERRLRDPILDMTDPLPQFTLEESQHLSKPFDESDLYQSDSSYEIDDGTESDGEPEMDHFQFPRGLEGVDYLEHVALKHHRSKGNRITENAVESDKAPLLLFDANVEVGGEAESPTADKVPDEETERAAWAHRQAGNLAEASTVYLHVINRCILTYGSQSVLTLKTLAILAEIYQDQGLLLLSIEAYQKVVDGYEIVYGTSALETLQAVHSLAKAMEETNEQPNLQRAESLYRRAIAGFETLGGAGLAPRLSSQHFLGDLLCDEKRYKEAKPMLIAAVSGYAALGLAHLEIVALGSLLELYNAMKDGRNLTRAISKMRKRLEERIDTDHEKFPEILIEGIHLANVYSDALKYEVAESLLSRIVPKVERLSDARFGIEKVYGYMEYGCLHQRKQRWGEASNYFRLAQDGLNKLGRHSDPVVMFVEARLVEIEKYSGGAYDKPELSQETLEQVSGVLRQNRRGALEADMASRGTKSVREEASEAGTSSCKIGITFSDSDIGDVSLSQYFYP